MSSYLLASRRAAVKIAIIGAGAIGGFYGLMLARAGNDVHFVVRSDYEAINRNGMHLVSNTLNDFVLANAQVYREIDDLPECDLLFVATKTTANTSIAPVLAKAAKAGSTVVILQNGLGVEDVFRSHLPEDVLLFGGLCVVSVHREAPGVVHHYGLGALNVGFHSGPNIKRNHAEQQLKALFDQADIELYVMSDLATARWQKLVMNIPFNGITVLLDSGTKAIRTQPETRHLVRQLMSDVAEGARLCGHPLPDGYVEEAWQASDGPEDYQSSMHVDFKAGRALELDAIYAAPLAAVKACGGEMPRIAMLYQALCFLDQRNRKK